MFARLFSARDRSPSVPQHIYGTLVTQARHPYFFTDVGMPDTPTGRFEMLSLHMFLFSHRLSGESDARASQLSQDVFDIFTAELDRALRQLGVGDPTVPKRKKRMITVFYAQIDQMAEALDKRDTNMLAERLLARAPDAPVNEAAAGDLAGYLLCAADGLAGQRFEDIAASEIHWPDPGHQ